MRDVEFTLTVPGNAKGPVPVVIFGHGLMTRAASCSRSATRSPRAASPPSPSTFRTTARRPLQATAVRRGHRPADGQGHDAAAVQSGSTCNELGKCVDANGQGNNLAMWPVLN